MYVKYSSIKTNIKIGESFIIRSVSIRAETKATKSAVTSSFW